MLVSSYVNSVLQVKKFVHLIIIIIIVIIVTKIIVIRTTQDICKVHNVSCHDAELSSCTVIHNLSC